MHSSVTNMELVENLVMNTVHIVENPGPVELEAENVSLSSRTEPESPEASANSDKGSEQSTGQFTNLRVNVCWHTLPP